MPTYPPTSQPTTPEHPVTASLVPPITVPTYGHGGTFSVLAKTYITAPPSLVLQAIRNTNEWGKWNSFCPRCIVETKSDSLDQSNDDEALGVGGEGWLSIGRSAVVDVFMNGDGLDASKKKSRVQGIVVTFLHALDDGRKGYVIAWKSTGYSHWQMHSERVMEFVEMDGGTEYTCWETFGGLLGSVVKATVGGTLVDRFGDYAGDLKGFVEGKREGAVEEAV